MCRKWCNDKRFSYPYWPSSKYLTTNQFLDEIDGNLKKKLN